MPDIGPTLMEGMERINIVVRNLGKQIGPPRRELYAMNVDKGRNYYNCGRFEHLARNCRNRENRIGESRRLEYEQGDNRQNNLNREQDLILLD